MPGLIKRVLRKTLLKGPLLEGWTRHQYRRFDRIFVRKLADLSRLPAPAPVPTPRTPRPKIRRLLVIADVMWEAKDLIPQLERIAPVDLLDLRPALRRPENKLSPPETVVCAVREFNAPEPDAILFYARGSLLSDEAFQLIRQRWRCPLIGMNLDDKANFFPWGVFSNGEDNYQRWARQFDVNLTNTLAAVEWYQRNGCACLYTPPGLHLPPGQTLPELTPSFAHELSFVGSSRAERRDVIDRLLALEFPVALFGLGWPKAQWCTDPVDVFRGSQINLGFGFCTATQSQTTVKGRDFECPGVGACYLTTYNWELMFHWELGKEILCYRSFEELVEMIAYYRRRPDECWKIARAAHRRAAAEHTWEHRFRRVFRELGFEG